MKSVTMPSNTPAIPAEARAYFSAIGRKGGSAGTPAQLAQRRAAAKAGGKARARQAREQRQVS